MDKISHTPKKEKAKDTGTTEPAPEAIPAEPAEIGGRGGLNPVRYGDWEIGGKCVDF